MWNTIISTIDDEILLSEKSQEHYGNRRAGNDEELFYYYKGKVDTLKKIRNLILHHLDKSSRSK